LLSPADAFLMNFSYANDDKIAARIGEPTVSIHPEEMAARQLSPGQKITLKNNYGELEVLVKASARIPLGVALLPKGRWTSLEKSGANINILNDGAKTDIGQSSAVHSIEVELVAN
jgi:anaerobic selenocysteine-containing dehydrogenase